MSELFLDQSAQVLDDWDAVRTDGVLFDSMRWSPDVAKRRPCPCPQCTVLRQSDGHRILFLQAFLQEFDQLRRRWKRERRAAARRALSMRRRPIVYDPRTDTILLPDGNLIDAAVATANLQRAFDGLDPFHYPMPSPGAAEYHRRRRARARRRR